MPPGRCAARAHWSPAEPGTQCSGRRKLRGFCAHPRSPWCTLREKPTSRQTRGHPGSQLDEIGFATTHDTGGGEIDPIGETLAPGEQVTISSYTFTHDKDGTVRGERDGHWFEVSPEGQYASDHFSP